MPSKCWKGPCLHPSMRSPSLWKGVGGRSREIPAASTSRGDAFLPVEWKDITGPPWRESIEGEVHLRRETAPPKSFAAFYTGAFFFSFPITMDTSPILSGLHPKVGRRIDSRGRSSWKEMPLYRGFRLTQSSVVPDSSIGSHLSNLRL